VLISVCYYTANAQTQVYTILFDRNSDDLNELAHKELELLIANIDSITIDSIKVSGYSDYIGNKTYNLELSEDRAINVEAYLKSRISEVRNYKNLDSLFHVKGFGELPSVLTPPGGIPEHRKVDIHVMNRKIRFISARNKKIKVFDPRKALEFDQIYILKRVHFIQDKPELLEQSVPVLKSFYKKLKTINGNFTLVISGHICCLDRKRASNKEKEFSKTLSAARALRVQEYLIQLGFSRENIAYEGNGFDQPLIYPEDKELDRLSNRRVEVLLIRND
jgi:outer membrane protein OmpA-like peptidoglycan-associated protein